MATSLDDLMDQYTQPTERNPESKGGLASLMDSQVRYEKEQLAASVTSAREISPDEVLRRKQTSRDLGVPEGVVKGDPETAARMAEVERVDRETADTPAVRQQYTDADFAALAKGPETGILAQIERKAKSLAASVAGFGGTLAGGMRTMGEMDRRDYTERVNELYSLLPEEKKARLVDAGVAKKTATGSLESVDDFKSDIVDWALERGERLKAVADELRPEDQTFVEQTIEGLGQLAAQVGLMALTRGGSAAMMFTMGVDQAAEKIKRDKVARETDRDLQDLEILTGGLVIGATEWLAGKFQLGKLQSKLLANTIAKRLVAIAEGGVVEGGQEAMENLLNDVAHIVMTNPDSKVGGMEAFQAWGVGTAVGALFQTMVQGALHIRGKRLQNTLASLSESAKLSDLRQKDPTTFQNVAEAIAGHLAQTSDGPVEDIYLDSTAFAQVALKAGVDPAEVAAELGVADQLEQAASAGGGDLVLPLQTVIGKIAGSELGDALIPHLRSGQDSLSISERETSAKMAGAWAERLTKAEEEITLTADQLKEFNRSATVVRQTFQAQLDKAGKYNPSQNRAMSSFLTAVYSNIARRRKEFTTPEQLYAMFPYKMEAGTQAGSSLAGVLQVSPEEATAMAATARKWGGRQKVYRAVESIVRQGDSVLDYGSGKLMEGRAAVVDRGGEYTPHDPYQGIQGDLSRAYDVVMASNVMNVQTKAEDAEGEYNRVLDELSGRVSETGTLVVNMPHSGPRADWMSPARLEADLKTRFKNVTRQGEVVYASNAEPRVPGQPWEKFDQAMTDADTMAEKIAAALTVEGPASPDSEVALPPHPEFAQLHPESIAEWEKRTTAWMKRQGYAPDEIAKHLSAMRGQLKIFAALGPVELELLPRSAGKSKTGPIRENSDVIYKLSFDASAMCVRRLEASATAAAIETKIGRSLTPSERMALVVLFQQAGKTAPCLYCYVEAPRAKMAEFAQRAVDVVLGNRAITEKWSAKTKSQAQEAIAEAKAKGLEKIDVNLVVDPAYQAAHPEETVRLAEETPKVWDFVRSMMLAAKANLPKLYEEYVGQILGIKQEVIEELNGYAGFRFFSSSDFQAEHVADLMQAIIDLELRKAKAHAYTKVVSFVEIFGRTGMKIQTSIFARESKDGVITPDTDQGMDWEEAKRLRKKFSNVGSVFVAASDAQLKWAMEQDWIDYIIPFHFSGMASAFYETLGYQDFTSTQTEAPIKKGEKAKKIRMHEITQGGKISDKEGTRRYLTLAMERGLYPVFPAAMFKGFEPVVRTGDAKKDKAARGKQNKAAREEWRKMVEAGKIDWSRINMNYFKVKKDYARTDTPFEPVQAKFDRAKASEKMNSFLEGNEPRAVADETITEQFLRLQEMHGDAMGIEALKARRENETFFAQMASSDPDTEQLLGLIKSPDTLKLFNDPQLKGRAGQKVSPQLIAQLAKQPGYTQVERDIISSVLASDQFAGQKKISFDAFRLVTESMLMSLDRINTGTLADYGLQNIGMDGTGARTIIYNSPIEHQYVGHFSGDFKSGVRGKRKFRIVATPQDPNTYVALDSAMPPGIQDPALITGYVGTAGSKAAVEEWVRNYETSPETPKAAGLFGHVRRKDEGAARFVTEMQSDFYQKNNPTLTIVEMIIANPDTKAKQLAVDKLENFNFWIEQWDVETRNLYREEMKRRKIIQEKKKALAQYERRGSAIEAGVVREQIEKREQDLDKLLNRPGEFYPYLIIGPSGEIQGSFTIPSDAVYGISRGSVQSRFRILMRKKDARVTADITTYGTAATQEEADEKVAEARNLTGENIEVFAVDTRIPINNEARLESLAKYKAAIKERDQFMLKGFTQFFTPEQKQLIAYRETHLKRLLREEIRQAAIDGKKSLLFPKPYTLAAIEGYVSPETDPSALEKLVVGDNFDWAPNPQSFKEDYVVVRKYGRTIEAVPLGEYNYLGSFKVIVAERRNAVWESIPSEVTLKFSADISPSTPGALAWDVGPNKIGVKVDLDEGTYDLFQDAEIKPLLDRILARFAKHELAAWRTGNPEGHTIPINPRDSSKLRNDVERVMISRVTDELESGDFILPSGESLRQAGRGASIYNNDEVSTFDVSTIVEISLEMKSTREERGPDYTGEELDDNLAGIVKKYTELEGMLKKEAGEVSTHVDAKGFGWYEIPVDPARAVEPMELFQVDPAKIVRATFDPQRVTTRFMEAADVSSFFHEGAHLFLEMYSTLAAYPNADETTKRDMQTLLEWFKIPDLDTWNRMSMLDRKPYHEQFAYNFETFIAEGKAPSPAMGRMFDRFKKWLTDAYKDIRASVNQIYKKEFGKDLPILTNEVRQVMERMISSDAQIERAQRARAMVPLFMTQSEALALGLTFTDDEWDAYRELHDDATNAATSELRAAYMQDMKWLTGAKSRALSALQRQTAATRKVVRAKVAKEVRARRIYQAEDALKKAKASGDPMAVAAVVDAYGPSPDEQGWPSQELLEAAIAAAPKRENVIEELTDQRMLEKHGEMMDPAQIEEATNRAVYNELRGRVLAAEFRALAKAEPPVRVLEDAARNLARLMVGKLTLTNLKASRYSRAEVRAGKMAMEAAKKGDIEATMDAKHNQLIHHMAAREVHRAKEQIRKAEKLFKKVFTADARLSKGYDTNYVGVARAILAQYGFGKSDKTADAHLELIRRYEPEFYAEIEPMLTAHKVAGRTLKDLTVDEFVDLAEQIEGLWHLARRTRQSLIDGKLVDRKLIVAELADRVRELTRPGVRPGEKRAATDWEKTKVQLLGAKAAMRRVESWVDFMDGKNPRGPFRRYIWEPISEAATRYRLEKVRYLSQYRDILAKYSDLMTGKELNFDGRYTFTSQEFLHALLHTGNKSNKTKLLVGRDWGTVDLDTGVLDASKWDAFVQANVTERQMDFCQEIWDLMESTKPAAQKAHKEMYGFFFGEITAEPVTIMVDGEPKTYRGGYVPAVTDSMQVTDAAINKEKEDAQGNNSYMFPTTGRGFTKQRIETYTKPLLLDLGYLHVHIDKVLRFSHLEPRIKDVGRVVKSNRAFGEALDRYDPTLRKDMLIPWLQRTATQLAAMPSEGEGGKLLDRLAGWARRAAGIQIMVGNVTNTMQQFTGLFIAMAKVRPRHLRNGTWRVMRQPKRTIAEIEAKSPFMRTRITESQYEIQSTINKLLLDPNPYQKLQQWFVEHGYVLQQFTQGFVDCSTWVGAYEQAVEQGHSEADAVRAADEAVRLTQGSFNPEDASRLETGHPFVRLFSQFMSYFNMQANILGTEFGKAVHDLGGVERMGRLLYVYAFAFMAPAVVSEIIVQALSGFDDGDDDEYDVTDAMRLFFGSQARTALAMAPGVGQAITSGVAAWNKNPMDDRIRASAAITTLEAAVRAPHAVYKAIAEEGNWKTGARDFLTLLGLISGLPLGQLGKPVGYALAVEQGKAEPESVGDVVRGVVSGQDVNRETN